jgi:phosphoglycerol transferase MdoB-like AlkP superfamily enzyme
MLTNNTVLIYSVFIALIKSLLFLGVIATEKATSIDFTRAFFGEPHLIVYTCFILIFLSFSFLFKGKAQLVVMAIFNLAFTLLLIADLWYYRGFNNFVTAHNLKMTGNLDNLLSDVLSMMRPIDFLFIIDLFLLFFMCIKLKGMYSKKKRSISAFFGIILLSISYISIIHYKVDIFEKGQNTILFRICWTPNQTMANLSPIGYHIYDVYNYWSESKPYHLSSNERTEIEQWYKDKKETLEPNQYKGMLKGKNLIVIQVESLENFVVNQKIEDQEISPNINKLLKNSLYFKNYHEQVYNGTSSDADLLTNTSVYPVRRGSTFFRYPYNTYNSLPNLLEKQGYATTAIHPDKGSYWNWQPALKSIGFQNTIDSASFNMDETIGLGLSDGSYLKQVEPIIKSQKAPFYTFLVTLTSHGPFDLPEEYRELKLQQELDKSKMGGYFQSIHYVDKHIGILMDNLDRSGMLDNSVVVIYGDHTGVHKYYEDEVAKLSKQEDWWKGNNCRIPLIIYDKSLSGEEISTIGGQVDLLPTLAYLMGIEDSDYNSTAMGRNLLNTKKNYTVLSNGEFIGEAATDKEKEDAIKGLELADKIIRSDYFKK